MAKNETGNIINEMQLGKMWNRALIICVERGHNMVKHGVPLMQIYNQIAKFTKNHKDLLINRLVVVTYSKVAIPIYFKHSLNSFSELVEAEMIAKEG